MSLWHKLRRLMHRHKWGVWEMWLLEKEYGTHPDAFTYRRVCLVRGCAAHQTKLSQNGKINTVDIHLGEP